jgi:tRNA nucleotidyltransferase (CCA-adding enzyme)
MHLVLTHEQTDFDALASLFAAATLQEGALPVLPRRLNRNVRSFVTLYGLEFNFLDPRDLPAGKVETVTLVDTQSLVTLKGMGAKTAVRVIDHHPLRPDLPEDWQVTIDEVGATTTLLVEALQVHNDRISPLQATLLMLGIYEDTGSLTYARTSPRDVRAAAWLLEQGANLSIAADFLNPPLSADQRNLYEVLLATAQTHQIHGHRIVIACGDAQDVDEEISTLAHKLRDLLDPDALFVLVATQEGVRLVARSTTEAIDVSRIAAEFGGGGHDRAAAALVRAQEAPPDTSMLEDACVQLLKVLPDLVRPSVMVSQIMSRRPQVLQMETPVKEVAKLMQRTGFEGYPVVQNGVVVGLLTRRAVDRALAHKLNLTASSLMEAGSVSVAPGDSLQLLQARMTDSGWGQIPVVDEDGSVIGIVTRTDLLKTLTPSNSQSRDKNLASRLESALPQARLELIQRAANEAYAQHMAVYIVGGFVRDLLLERPSLDFDIVVEGDAIALGKSLAKVHGGRVTSHARFGTAKWFLPKDASGGSLPEFLDLISARTEFYEHPTALPTVERGSIKLDLHRRDFTINTLALRLDGRHYGELHDYWGGLADLERGLVRVLHSLSFVDDPTRLLRAVRYERRYDFAIEARTRELMEQASPLLEKLSPERVRHELDLILDEPNVVPMLQRLSELGLLKAIDPSLSFRSSDLDGLEEPLPEMFSSIRDSGLSPLRRSLGWSLWLSSLSESQIKLLARRLRFPATLTRLCTQSARLQRELPDLSGSKPSKWVEHLEDYPDQCIYAVYLRSGKKEKEVLTRYLTQWRQVKPTITGHDLKARGLPPGPSYQNVLRKLRQAWLDGQISTPAEELELLERYLEAMEKA